MLGHLAKIPNGILARCPVLVNTNIATCTAKSNFANLSINDLLENIRLILKYILSRKAEKVKSKNKFMAKAKNPLIKSKQSELLIYTKRKSKDDFTHNVRARGLKSKKKKLEKLIEKQ